MIDTQGLKNSEQLRLEIEMANIFTRKSNNLTKYVNEFINLMQIPSFLNRIALKLINMRSELSKKEHLVQLREILYNINLTLFMNFRDKKLTFAHLKQYSKDNKSKKRLGTNPDVSDFIKEIKRVCGTKYEKRELITSPMIYSKKIEDLSFQEILKPRENWEDDKHCMRSLKGVKVKIGAPRDLSPLKSK